MIRARSVGPATVTVIEQILDSQVIEAQGYLSCQNILDGLGAMSFPWCRPRCSPSQRSSFAT